MQYYQNIILIPDIEIPIYFLWQKLYQQIHLALVENKDSANQSFIGVSFPDYNATEYLLGTKLRLFAKEEKLLEQVDCKKWLDRFSDYLHISNIKPVPSQIDGHACFRHIKPKGSKDKLARRRAKRKGETLQQALSHFEGFEEQRNKLPYINMLSQTNGHHFRLFIEKKKMEHPQTGVFSCYGLSKTTTVPLF